MTRDHNITEGLENNKDLCDLSLWHDPVISNEINDYRRITWRYVIKMDKLELVAVFRLPYCNVRVEPKMGECMNPVLFGY